MTLYKILTPVLLLFSSAVFAQVSPPPPVDSLDKIFTKVDVEANFPGGDNAWRDYLRKNLNPGVPVDNGAPAGRYTVIVQFIISKDGRVSGIKAETKMGYGMEEEVLRIIKKSGDWTPASQNNRTVNAYRRQPVTFLIEDDDFEINATEPFTLFTGENIIKVKAKKVKSSNITVSISQGTITPTDDEGEYTVRVSKPGRVTITLYNSKTGKEIGAASFEVKVKK